MSEFEEHPLATLVEGWPNSDILCPDHLWAEIQPLYRHFARHASRRDVYTNVGRELIRLVMQRLYLIYTIRLRQWWRGALNHRYCALAHGSGMGYSWIDEEMAQIVAEKRRIKRRIRESLQDEGVYAAGVIPEDEGYLSGEDE